MERRVTMVDVAREAGVALRTVSRVVNGANVRPDLVERVEEAIARLGYRRNLMAASIRPGWSSKVIAFLISDLANPHYWWLARHIEAVVKSRGYLLITASSEDGTEHDALVDRLMEQRVDGIIISPARDAVRSWTAVPPPIPPLVFIDRPTSDGDPADAVVSDEYGGAREATAELLRHGARRVAFVGGDRSIYAIGERHRGYADAVRDAGADSSGLEHFGAHTRDDAAEIVGELLDTGAADAIFAANNRASVGALAAFADRHRRIPLIGFDDFESATVVSPGVSVVNQDAAAMAAAAAEILLGRLDGTRTADPQTHVLPVSLILRGSELP
jgi:LacI family transcriptional regulator